MATKIQSKAANRRISPKPTKRAATAADLIENIAQSMENLPESAWKERSKDASKNVDRYLYGNKH